MGIGSATDQAERERIAAREKENKERQEAREAQARQERESQTSTWSGMSDYDKSAVLDPHNLKPTTGEIDYAQRELIKGMKEEGSSQAAEWVSQDQKAREARAEAEKRQKKIDRRSDKAYVGEVYEKYQAARDDKHKLIEDGRPPIWPPSRRKEWDERLKGLELSEQKARDAYEARLKKSEPEELKRLQDTVAEKLQVAGDAVQKRRSLYPTASEAASIEGAKFDPERHLAGLKEAWKPSDMAKDTREIEQRITSKEPEIETQKRRHAQAG